MSLTPEQYEHLLRMRTQLRSFLSWSEEQIRQQGVPPAQHQLLLAISSRPPLEPPTVTNIADTLMLRHNSAVELIDRAQQAGFVERHRDIGRHSVVRIALTSEGRRKLNTLESVHLSELELLEPVVQTLMAVIDAARDRYGLTR